MKTNHVFLKKLALMSSHSWVQEAEAMLLEKEGMPSDLFERDSPSLRVLLYGGDNSSSCGG